MLTLHVTTLARRSAAFLLLAGLLGCNGKSGEDQTPAAKFCSTLSEYATACPALATPCDQAMINDCAGVVGLVSDGFLQNATDCITTGGSPLTCLGGAILGLKPSAAHEAFVNQFCDECAFGVPGCADILLGQSEGPPELKVVSVLILPLGDSLVDALREQCASGLTCLATFPSCVQKVLIEQAIPEETLQCVLDSFQGKLPEGAPAPEDLEACGLGGESGTGGASNASNASNVSQASNASDATDGTPTTSGATEAVTTENDPSAGSATTSTTGDDTTGPVDPSVADTGDDDTTGNPPGPDMGGDTDGWDALCAEPFTEHGECTPGGPLPAECTWCSYLICTHVDDYCCTTAWDDQCVAAANERCSAACGAPGVCEHSACEAGTKLNATCSDCVLAVCEGKPSCCSIEWTGECALMALDCGVC